jgi:hypothetical protein
VMRRMSSSSATPTSSSMTRNTRRPNTGENRLGPQHDRIRGRCGDGRERQEARALPP